MPRIGHPDLRYLGKAPVTAHKVDIKAADGGTTTWGIPEEMPVAFVYNGRNYAVMLATPDDMADFAIGFSLTERVVRSVDEIQTIDVDQQQNGIELRISLAPKALERFDILQKRRNLVGKAGCGICGLDNAESLVTPLPRVQTVALADPQRTMNKALVDFREHQPLNNKTRTVHGAAWV